MLYSPKQSSCFPDGVILENVSRNSGKMTPGPQSFHLISRGQDFDMCPSGHTLCAVACGARKNLTTTVLVRDPYTQPLLQQLTWGPGHHQACCGQEPLLPEQVAPSLALGGESQPFAVNAPPCKPTEDPEACMGQLVRTQCQSGPSATNLSC